MPRDRSCGVCSYPINAERRWPAISTNVSTAITETTARLAARNLLERLLDDHLAPLRIEDVSAWSQPSLIPASTAPYIRTIAPLQFSDHIPSGPGLPLGMRATCSRPSNQTVRNVGNVAGGMRERRLRRGRPRGLQAK
eukprot:755846-Hanusia_phi.AAC.3